MKKVARLAAETSSTNQLNLSGVDGEFEENTEKDTGKKWKSMLGSGGSLLMDDGQVTQLII